MSLTEVKNHADQAVLLLLEQFKDQSNIEGLIRAVVASVQDLEPILFDLEEDMRLSSATNVTLDMVGRIVQLDRGALSDDDYRVRLQARIRANRSEGTPADVLAVLKLMVPDNDRSIEEYYPAAFVLRIADTLSEDPDVVASEIARTRAAGVGAVLEYTLAEDEDTFQFASGDSEESDADAGWSDGAGSGGDFAGAVEA